MSYTVSDLTSAVQDDLKDSSFSTTRILRYLNRGQQLIFNTRYLKFMEQSDSTTLASAAYSKALPTDHQATIGGALIVQSSNAVALTLDETTFLPHREFFQRYPNPSEATAARPSTWTEYGTSMWFNCPSDATYDFNRRYYRTPTELTGNSDVPDLPAAFREALELYCLYRAEKYRGNHDVAATYLQDFEDELEAVSQRYSGPTQVAPGRIRQRRVRTGDY